MVNSCGTCQGLVYTNTDVEEVHLWMVKHFTEHPLFTRVPEDELVGVAKGPLKMSRKYPS